MNVASDKFSAVPCPLSIAHDPAINGTFQQDAILVVKELRFQNDGVARKDLVIRVSTEPGETPPAEIRGSRSRPMASFASHRWI